MRVYFSADMGPLKKNSPTFKLIYLSHAHSSLEISHKSAYFKSSKLWSDQIWALMSNPPPWLSSPFIPNRLSRLSLLHGAKRSHVSHIDNIVVLYAFIMKRRRTKYLMASSSYPGTVGPWPDSTSAHPGIVKYLDRASAHSGEHVMKNTAKLCLLPNSGPKLGASSHSDP